jgi:hypothetical protein
VLNWEGATGSHPGEGGQALILMLLAITVIFAMGAIALDFGLWLTERQGAQKDADSASLAGAYELLRQDFADPADNDPPSVRAAAEDAVYTWGELNGLEQADVADLLVADTDCLGPSQVIDSVSIAAEHHSPALFTSIFGGVAPEIGAPATACLGSVSTLTGLLPVAIQIGGPSSGCWADLDGDGKTEPRLGRTCALRFGDEESDHATSIRLYDNGSDDCSDRNTSNRAKWQDQVEQGGADSECHVYNYFPDLNRCSSDGGGCVYVVPGVDTRRALDAFQELISGERECDRTFGDRDGVDELREILVAADGDPSPPGDSVFIRRDCTSPRLVSLAVVGRFSDQPSRPMPIEAFATFLIAGCELGDQFDRRCSFDDDDDNHDQFRLRGSFVDLLVSSGTADQISKWSPKRIILVE